MTPAMSVAAIRPRLAVLLDDAVDDDDECTRRPAYLHAAAAQQRDEESGDDGRDDAFFGRYARGDAEGDGEREGHDAHDDAGHEVRRKSLFVVVFQCLEQFRSKFESFHKQILN